MSAIFDTQKIGSNAIFDNQVYSGSSVSNDLTVVHDIISIVSNDVVASWNVESTMLTAFSDITVGYNILQNVINDLAILWNTIQQVVSDKTIGWDILNTVFSDKDLVWGIATAVVNDLIIISNLFQSAAKDITITWDSAGIVSGDLVIRYNISSDNVILPTLERILVVTQQERIFKVKSIQ